MDYVLRWTIRTQYSIASSLILPETFQVVRLLFKRIQQQKRVFSGLINILVIGGCQMTDIWRWKHYDTTMRLTTSTLSFLSRRVLPRTTTQVFQRR